MPLRAFLYSSACTTVLSLPLMLTWQSVMRLQMDQNIVILCKKKASLVAFAASSMKINMPISRPAPSGEKAE